MNPEVLDIPRVYTGIAEWMACMLYAMQLRPRLPRKWFIATAILGLAVQCLFLMATDNIVIFLWVPCMAAAFVMMTAQAMLLCDDRTGNGLGIIASIILNFGCLKPVSVMQ